MKNSRQVERDFLEASRDNRNDGLAWYDIARGECERLASFYGLSLPVIAGVVSSVSPLCPWNDNIKRAEKLIAWHCAGREGERPSVTFSAHCAKADRILALQAPEWEFRPNTKTRSFWRNLCGDLNYVTIDTWMLVYHGSARKSLSRSRYWSACSPIVDAAFRLGALPAQLQAVIWLETRDKEGRRVAESIPD